MYIEHWSHEEIEHYRKNPNLLFSKVNELRSRVIMELVVQLIRRMASIFKYQGRKSLKSSNDKFCRQGFVVGPTGQDIHTTDGGLHEL